MPDMSLYDLIQMAWGIVAGLVLFVALLTGVYWKLVIIGRAIIESNKESQKETINLLKELLGAVKEMSSNNTEDHKEFMDMITRMDERSKK